MGQAPHETSVRLLYTPLTPAPPRRTIAAGELHSRGYAMKVTVDGEGDGTVTPAGAAEHMGSAPMSTAEKVREEVDIVATPSMRIYKCNSCETVFNASVGETTTHECMP